MKVYRGPRSKPFYDDSHAFVAKIKPEELEEGIRSSARIQFDVTKDGYERQSVCTIQLEWEDIIPMISGLLSRLKLQQEIVARIKGIMDDKYTDKDEILPEIRAELAIF